MKVDVENQFASHIIIIITILLISRLENLPFSLMKLKKLKALWLSENQV